MTIRPAGVAPPHVAGSDQAPDCTALTPTLGGAIASSFAKVPRCADAGGVVAGRAPAQATSGDADARGVAATTRTAASAAVQIMWKFRCGERRRANRHSDSEGAAADRRGRIRMKSRSAPDDADPAPRTIPASPNPPTTPDPRKHNPRRQLTLYKKSYGLRHESCQI
jgi:hypothetical protein